MKLLPIFILVVGFAFSAAAKTWDVGYGTIEVSDDFDFKHTGTKDSFMGTLTRKTDGFTITFDVGAMAGTHMHEEMKAVCSFFRSHEVGGLPALTGIQWIPDGRRITTTIGAPLIKNPGLPANFWADFKADSEIAEFLLIVTTFKAKPAGQWKNSN